MRNLQLKPLHICSFLVMLSFSLSLKATLLDDITYSALQAELGVTTPDGSGVAVSIVEAFTGADCDSATMPENCTYLPDSAIETYTDQSAGLGFSTGFSSHATGSANGFYGASSSTPGISDIDAYAANHWLSSGYLNTELTVTPKTSTTRVSTHSYVGSADTEAENLELLQRIDYLADRDNHILGVAMNNGATNRPLNGTSYNSIVVGRTDASHPTGTVNINPSGSIYSATNRSGADIVVPETTTSGATPRVSSAAALLVGYGHDQGLTKSHGFTTNRNSDVIYNAETSEAIKAALMAGASRTTSNTDGRADISGYRSAGNQTMNGLDTRYGAGQLNIQNSYHIIDAGEQEAGMVNSTGFDYQESFGGLSGSDTTASYFFSAVELSQFAAALVWNLSFDTASGDESADFDEYTATLFDLNLQLFSLESGVASLIASSLSTVDNSENIWLEIMAGDYRLDVLSNDEVDDFDSDYAVAWQTTAVPLPATVWLMISAISGLALLRRKKRKLS